MSGIPDSLRAAMDRLAQTRSLRAVDAVLAEIPEPGPAPEPPGPRPAPARFQPSAIGGQLPWWAKD